MVEGERNGWVGVGPTLLPRIVWVGSRTPGPGLEEGGWLAVYQFGCQAVGHGAKRGQQATRWQSQVSETDHFHCAASQYPPPELECLLAISCCQPPDPHPRHPSAFRPTLLPCAGVLESLKRPPPASLLSYNHPGQCNNLCCAVLQKNGIAAFTQANTPVGRQT